MHEWLGSASWHHKLDMPTSLLTLLLLLLLPTLLLPTLLLLLLLLTLLLVCAVCGAVPAMTNYNWAACTNTTLPGGRCNGTCTTGTNGSPNLQCTGRANDVNGGWNLTTMRGSCQTGPGGGGSPGCVVVCVECVWVWVCVCVGGGGVGGVGGGGGGP
jgi:hypothetical protein